MESGWLISLHSEGVMYLRRQVRQAPVRGPIVRLGAD